MRGDRRLLLLLLLLLALCSGAAQAAATLKDAPQVPAVPAKAHCRVFLAADASSTRAALLSSSYDREGVVIHDAFAPALNSLVDLEAFESADKAYESVLLLLAREVADAGLVGDARACRLHLLAIEHDEAEADKIGAWLAQLAALGERDADFPFSARKEDARALSSDWRRFFQAAGANYLAGNVPASLAPGASEVLGLLHADDARAALAFDQQERWRRNKRLRQAAAPLNLTDFYAREFTGFGRAGVAKSLLQSAPDAHPCYFKGDTVSVNDAEVTGSGSARECLAQLTDLVERGNAGCPSGSFCLLGGSAQPRPLGALFASGVLRSAVLLAARALVDEHDEALALSLPSPPLGALEDAANSLCALSADKVTAAAAKLHGEDDVDAHSACLDLCHAVVLLKRIGLGRDDARVMFLDHLGSKPEAGDEDKTSVLSDQVEQRAWMAGAFLYAEAEQRKRSYSLEADLLALQVSEGLPIGWNLSALVFLAAVAYLYRNTGASQWRRRGGYASVAGSRRSSSFGDGLVVNGGDGASGKAKYSDTTQSILFLDDASE